MPRNVSTKQAHFEELNNHQTTASFRVAGGGLTDSAGRVETLDALAVKFMGAADKAAVAEEANTATKDMDK